MALTREEFDILSSLATSAVEPCASASLDKLRSIGLVSGAAITELGLAALEPYRVENAVIMAAGLSSRFVPISYWRPKGLMRVNGEVLIERQIRQLHEVGITNITVVVGYRADEFAYLAEKYGVRLVTNDLYAARNNNWTLWLVHDQLRNTYICSSDDYFVENPFETYVYRAYYSAVFMEGPTGEWCLGVDGEDRITSVTVGGRDAWAMLGHVYFDRAFSNVFARILDGIVHGASYEERYADKLWEAIFARNLDCLSMDMRRYPADQVLEFDSVDELMEFDPSSLSTVECPAIENITSVLGCERAQLHGFYPIKNGLTNLSFHFAVGEDEYVYRHPGVGTEKFINRTAERDANTVAHDLGIDHTFIYENAEEGWKISRFVPNARNADPLDASEVSRAMRLARTFHESDAHIDATFDFYKDGLGYERLLKGHGDIDVPGYDKLREKVTRLNEYCTADEGFPVCFCHNDYLPLNFLIGEDNSMSVIDWEFAGMGDPGNDTATFIICSQYDEDQANAAIDAYFGRAATPAERRHFWARVVLGGWCWYVWALEKDAEGAGVGEWLDIYKSYAVLYVDKVLSWYEKNDILAA